VSNSQGILRSGASMSRTRRDEVARQRLADRLARQERAIQLVRDAAGQVEAPAALRERVESLHAPRRGPSRTRLLGLAAIAGAFIAAAARARSAIRR
jgi:hypothetical protein